MAGSHGDCVVSWDTVGGIQAFDCLQGPPQTGFGVAQDGPVAVLAVLQGKLCLVASREGLGTWPFWSNLGLKITPKKSFGMCLGVLWGGIDDVSR